MPPTRTFPDLPTALTALARAAVNLANAPKELGCREEYDAVRRGVAHIVGTMVSDEGLKSRREHYQWIRRVLRTALEDPEMQPTDSRYLGYLAALRLVAKGLRVTWPPYGPDDAVHDSVPAEALDPQDTAPPAKSRRGARRR